MLNPAVNRIAIMYATDHLPSSVTRRAFLGRSAAGLGMLGLASLLKPDLLQGADTGIERWPGVPGPLRAG